MTSAPVLASFKALPPEILFNVLSRLNSPASLYCHVAIASPSASRVFAALGPDTLEPVLVTSVPIQLEFPIRAVALIHMKVPPTSDLKAFRDKYARRRGYDLCDATRSVIGPG